jgi:hypothetical protein
MAAVVGSTWNLHENLSIDGAMRFGLTESMPAWNTTIGITIGI